MLSPLRRSRSESGRSFLVGLYGRDVEDRFKVLFIECAERQPLIYHNLSDKRVDHSETMAEVASCVRGQRSLTCRSAGPTRDIVPHVLLDPFDFFGVSASLNKLHDDETGKTHLLPLRPDFIEPRDSWGVVADEIYHDIGVEKQHDLPLSLFRPLPQLPRELDAITDIRAVFPHTDER